VSDDEGGICANCGLPQDLCKNIDINDLATKLKGKLACGGAAKRGHVELQGDHRGVIGGVLAKLGFPEEMVQIDWTFQRKGRR